MSFREVHHEPTRTSGDSARVRGEELRNGGKALVMKLDDDFALFVLPADRRAHSGTIRRTLGVPGKMGSPAEELAELTAAEGRPGLVPGSVRRSVSRSCRFRSTSTRRSNRTSGSLSMPVR
ncbi:MAG: hypothetical protein Ct9H300mP1_11600 [Planctomycetaceae bacterium]|nr:MAG: hypothetical protein Ct9H300mP1_11600 [Planctomycetaceae bacterium]